MRKGFTLAEVLITLTMIGVLSALSIPSLINNISDQQNKIRWKNTYSNLSQATMRMASDNGGNIKGLCNTHDCFKNLFKPYLNYIKDCQSGAISGNCWHSHNGTDYNAKYLNGTNVTNSTWSTNASAMILNDGIMLYFLSMSQSCTSTYGSVPVCADIFVDINGFNSPNTIGKDIFFILLQENGIKPAGTQGDPWPPSASCIEGNASVSNNGFGCSALYLYQ